MLDFIRPSTIETAQALLGQLMVYDSPQGRVSGYIVETEAYVGIEDAACHTFQGKRTPRLEAMYQLGGTIYVYTMHTHRMLNIVTKEMDEPQAVLIRGIEPVENLQLMMANRGKEGRELTNGPGKLTKALGISADLNGQMLGGKLRLELAEKRQPKEISVSPRIGIPNKGKWTTEPLRFFVAGHPYVSLMRKGQMNDSQQVWQSR